MARPTRTNWTSFATILGVMILVGTEVFGVALAAGWAIAGLLELGSTFEYILMGLFSLIGAYSPARSLAQSHRDRADQRVAGP